MKQADSHLHCSRCAYDLTGNLSDRCPECGWIIDWGLLRAPLPPLVVSRRTAETLTWFAMVTLPFQVFLCSGGWALDALTGANSGAMLDQVFADILIELTLLSALAFLAGVGVFTALRKNSLRSMSFGMLLATLAMTSTGVASIGRVWILSRRGISMGGVVDMLLSVLAIAAYLLVRRRCATLRRVAE